MLQNPAAQPPAAFVTDCDDPIILLPGPLTAGSVARGWAHDRGGLVDCKAKHQALRAFYHDLLAGLGGPK